MSLIPRWRRILCISAFCAAIFLIGVAALLSIQQHILRWRAERLLSDIRDLQLGKSTWADAQRIMTRWGAWGHYVGSCTQERCSYQIELKGPECPPSLYAVIRALPLLATRDADISADLQVIHGIVWGKDFAVYLVVAGGISSDDYEYGLLASSNTLWRTSEFQRYNFGDHPDYVVGHPGGCEGCESVYSRFTPFVDPGLARDLMDFNLDCLTRLFQCRDQIDIMPRVWKQVQAEEEQFAETQKEHPGYLPSPPSPEFLGRDRANVVIAEVVSTRIEGSPSGETNYSTFRLDQRLKRATFWDQKQLIEDYPLSSHALAGKGDEGKLVAPGKKVILAFDTLYNSGPHHSVNLADDCEVIPLTNENLDAVRRGMQLDIFPD
jgi:hypothetical protein